MLPLLALASPARGDTPAGIYSLGQARLNPNASSDARLWGIRDYDFVSGFTLRTFWSDLEPTRGQYEFGFLNEAIKRVSALGQSLDIEIFTNNEPQYVLDGASATYTDHAGNVNPVPWDAFAQQRHAALFTALSNYTITSVGAPHPLRLDATLTSIDVAPAGLNYGVRDLNGGIRNHPEYTQERYIDAVMNGVAAATSAFPHDTNSLAFFSFDDGADGPHVDDQLIARLAPLYNGPGQPRLAFFVENLSDNWPLPLNNGHGLGNNLQDWVAEGGETMMQALDKWLDHPPARDEALASLNPATGIELAYDLYGTRFFELYPPDLDGAVAGAVDAAGRPLLDDLRHWSNILTSEDVQELPADFNGDGLVNAADLPTWQTSFGGEGADADLDGDADGADLLAWQRQLGASAAGGLAVVPEPLGACLFALGMAGLGRYLRPRRAPLA
ncbi:MAG TPA: hypothetical protein VF175_02900 [Lacipirellula sp.]